MVGIDKEGPPFGERMWQDLMLAERSIEVGEMMSVHRDGRMGKLL
jgi:hypothetical protein